jgi:hypothetical protein
MSMSVGSVSKPQVATTLANAASAGIISTASQAAIETELDDIALAGCAGINVDEIDSEEVTLVTVLIDASDSMGPYATEVIQAYKEQFLEPLKKAKNADSILVSAWIFSRIGEPKDNVRLVHGFTPVPQCPELTSNNYQPSGMTPLYDAVFKGTTGLVSYGQNLRDNGTRTKSIVVVLSDGWENASQIGKSKVKNLSADVLKAQEFVLAYVFFGEESEGDEAAKDIGFPPHHRLTSDLDGSGIRRVFGTVSASVISTSQAQVSAGSLSSNAFFAQGR